MPSVKESAPEKGATVRRSISTTAARRVKVTVSTTAKSSTRLHPAVASVAGKSGSTAVNGACTTVSTDKRLPKSGTSSLDSTEAASVSATCAGKGRKCSLTGIGRGQLSEKSTVTCFTSLQTNSSNVSSRKTCVAATGAKIPKPAIGTTRNNEQRTKANSTRQSAVGGVKTEFVRERLSYVSNTERRSLATSSSSKSTVNKVPQKVTAMRAEIGKKASNNNSSKTIDRKGAVEQLTEPGSNLNEDDGAQVERKTETCGSTVLAELGHCADGSVNDLCCDQREWSSSVSSGVSMVSVQSDTGYHTPFCADEFSCEVDEEEENSILVNSIR